MSAEQKSNTIQRRSFLFIYINILTEHKSTIGQCSPSKSTL
jgi:hypothetical protein